MRGQSLVLGCSAVVTVIFGIDFVIDVFSPYLQQKPVVDAASLSSTQQKIPTVENEEQSYPRSQRIDS